MTPEYELLINCLQRLNRLGLPYMVAGSMASSYWGDARSTHDVDIVLMMTPADVPAFISAFEAGFFVQPELVRKAFAYPFQFNVMDESSPMKADFFLVGDNELERAAFARRIEATILNTPAWVTTPEDIILHKLYWHTLTPSDRQLRDAAAVFANQSESIDREYLRNWAKKLNVEQELDDILSGRIKPKST